MKTGHEYAMSIIADLKSKFYAAQQKCQEYQEEIEKLEKKMAATRVVAERNEVWTEMIALKRLQEEPQAEANAYRIILDRLRYI